MRRRYNRRSHPSVPSFLACWCLLPLHPMKLPSLAMYLRIARFTRVALALPLDIQNSVCGSYLVLGRVAHDGKRGVHVVTQGKDEIFRFALLPLRKPTRRHRASTCSSCQSSIKANLHVRSSSGPYRLYGSGTARSTRAANVASGRCTSALRPSQRCSDSSEPGQHGEGEQALKRNRVRSET